MSNQSSDAAMVATAPGIIPLALPASLTRQFGLLEQRLWRTDAIVAAAGGASSLLLSYLAQFALDRLWDTPEWLRFSLAACGWTGFVIFACGYGNLWIWRRRSTRTLAMIVQRQHRRLGDRLLGIVELSDPDARPSNYSAELCRAAIAQVAGEASSFDFQEAAADRKSRKLVAALGALTVLAMVIAIAVPDAGRNALLRWFWPLANIERYTFAVIEPLPDHLVVAQGETFDVTVKLARNSFWRPRTASVRLDGLSATEVPVQDGLATYHSAGQTQERSLRVAIGDVVRTIRIQPAVRPDLKQLAVALTLPAYLHYPPQKQTLDSNRLTFLPGTNAVFMGEVDRTLAAAVLAGQPPASIDGTHFTTPPVLLELSRDLNFTWRDTLGLAGPAATTIHAIAIEDQPPQIALGGIEGAAGILADETLQLQVNATDDFGVKRVALTWQRGSASPMETPGPVSEIKLADGQPQSKSLGAKYGFNPAALSIAPDTTILVRGAAIDYYPTREPSLSQVYRIHVLSPESHARLIHDQLEKLLEQFDELTRRQAQLLQASKALPKDPAKLGNDDSTQKLGDQSTAQKANADALAALSRQIASTVAEALRNPTIPAESLKQWAQHAQDMNQLATSAMPTAAQSLDSAKADAAPSQRQDDAGKAVAQEQNILNAMRQMEQESSNDLESMAAHTLAARMHKVAAWERSVAAIFREMLPDAIGLAPDQLSADQTAKMKSAGGVQDDINTESGRLEEEIARLYDRTSLSRYGDVAHEMDSYKTADGLTALGDLISKNIGVESIETAIYWAGEFDLWANRLDAKDNSKSQQSSQPGQPDPKQMEALLKLMRLRQQQDQLRDKTSSIDQQKNSPGDNYKKQAGEAAAQQGALHDEVDAFATGPDAIVKPLQIAPVAQAMNDAAKMLAKPETGQPTDSAQTDAVDLLDELIAQQAKQAGQSASQLMRMMGMGNSPGGNTSHNSTNSTNVTVTGSTDSRAPDAHTVLQAGGGDNSQLPGEFRDAIENYDHTIERNGTP